VYVYKLEVTRVYDGDTVNGIVDLGFNLKMAIKIRLADINTPEIRTKDLEEKQRGYAARDFLRDFLEKYKDGLMVRTKEKGKYGRWIGELLLSVDDFGHDEELVKYENNARIWGFDYIDINEILVEEGHAERRSYQ